MADAIEQLEKLLRPCKDLHSLFNFTALRELEGNETKPVVSALLLNVTLCLKRLRTTADPSRQIASTTTLPTYPHPVLTTYLVFVAVFGLATNLCVIGTICRARRLWTITNAFVLSLAVADFLMASVLTPLNIQYRYFPSQHISTAKDTLFPLLGAASLLNLAAVTLERFMSISYPLTYDMYLNRFRATIIIATVWLVSFFQAFLPLAFRGESIESKRKQLVYEDVRFAFVFALPCLCLLVVNFKIYCVARAHARQINAANPEPSSNRAFIKKLKTVKIIALLVGTFMLTWLPYFVLSIYQHHGRHTDNENSMKIAELVTEALVCTTALLNPLLYGLLRKDVREAIFKGLKCQNVNQTELHSVSYSFRTEYTATMATKTTNEPPNVAYTK